MHPTALPLAASESAISRAVDASTADLFRSTSENQGSGNVSLSPVNLPVDQSARSDSRRQRGLEATATTDDNEPPPYPHEVYHPKYRGNNNNSSNLSSSIYSKSRDGIFGAIRRRRWQQDIASSSRWVGTGRLWIQNTIATSRYSRSIRLRGHYGCVNVVNFSPDGRLLVSGGDDERLLLWDMARPSRQIPIEEIQTNHVSNIFSACFDDQQNYILSAGNDARVIRVKADDHRDSVSLAWDPLVDGAVHQSTFVSRSSNVCISAFETGSVRLSDFRTKTNSRPNARNRSNTVGLAAVHCSSGVHGVAIRPSHTSQFIVASGSAMMLMDMRSFSEVKDPANSIQGIEDVYRPLMRYHDADLRLDLPQERRLGRHRSSRPGVLWSGDILGRLSVRFERASSETEQTSNSTSRPQPAAVSTTESSVPKPSDGTFEPSPLVTTQTQAANPTTSDPVVVNAGTQGDALPIVKVTGSSDCPGLSPESVATSDPMKKRVPSSEPISNSSRSATAAANRAVLPAALDLNSEGRQEGGADTRQKQCSESKAKDGLPFVAIDLRPPSEDGHPIEVSNTLKSKADWRRNSDGVCGSGDGQEGGEETSVIQKRQVPLDDFLGVGGEPSRLRGRVKDETDRDDPLSQTIKGLLCDEGDVAFGRTAASDCDYLDLDGVGSDCLEKAPSVNGKASKSEVNIHVSKLPSWLLTKSDGGAIQGDADMGDDSCPAAHHAKSDAFWKSQVNDEDGDAVMGFTGYTAVSSRPPDNTATLLPPRRRRRLWRGGTTPATTPEEIHSDSALTAHPSSDGSARLCKSHNDNGDTQAPSILDGIKQCGDTPPSPSEPSNNGNTSVSPDSTTLQQQGYHSSDTSFGLRRRPSLSTCIPVEDDDDKTGVDHQKYSTDISVDDIDINADALFDSAGVAEEHSECRLNLISDLTASPPTCDIVKASLSDSRFEDTDEVEIKQKVDKHPPRQYRRRVSSASSSTSSSSSSRSHSHCRGSRNSQLIIPPPLKRRRQGLLTTTPSTVPSTTTLRTPTPTPSSALSPSLPQTASPHTDRNMNSTSFSLSSAATLSQPSNVEDDKAKPDSSDYNVRSTDTTSLLSTTAIKSQDTNLVPSRNPIMEFNDVTDIPRRGGLDCSMLVPNASLSPKRIQSQESPPIDLFTEQLPTSDAPKLNETPQLSSISAPQRSDSKSKSGIQSTGGGDGNGSGGGGGGGEVDQKNPNCAKVTSPLNAASDSREEKISVTSLWGVNSSGENSEDEIQACYMEEKTSDLLVADHQQTSSASEGHSRGPSPQRRRRLLNRGPDYNDTSSSSDSSQSNSSGDGSSSSKHSRLRYRNWDNRRRRYGRRCGSSRRSHRRRCRKSRYDSRLSNEHINDNFSSDDNNDNGSQELGDNRLHLISGYSDGCSGTEASSSSDSGGNSGGHSSAHDSYSNGRCNRDRGSSGDEFYPYRCRHGHDEDEMDDDPMTSQLRSFYTAAASIGEDTTLDDDEDDSYQQFSLYDCLMERRRHGRRDDGGCHDAMMILNRDYVPPYFDDEDRAERGDLSEASYDDEDDDNAGSESPHETTFRSGWWSKTKDKIRPKFVGGDRAAFSNDGSLLLLIRRIKAPLVFAVENPTPLYELRSGGFINRVTLKSGCWLPDDRHIAIGSENRRVHIWQLPPRVDLKARRTVALWSRLQLSGHRSIVNCCAAPPSYPLSRGLPLLVTSGIEKMVRLWHPCDDWRDSDDFVDRADFLSPTNPRFVCPASREREDTIRHFNRLSTRRPRPFLRGLVFDIDDDEEDDNSDSDSDDDSDDDDDDGHDGGDEVQDDELNDTAHQTTHNDDSSDHNNTRQDDEH